MKRTIIIPKSKMFKSGDIFVRAANETESNKDGTIRLIWGTGYKDLRQTEKETFYEELEMSASAVDLSRLNSGSAPLIIQHDDTVQSVIGVVERAWIEDGVGYADVRLSKRPEVAGYVSDIIDGILRNVSVGYKIKRYTDMSEKGDTVRTLLATNWMPMEISIVAMGFDPHARTLRQDGDDNEVEITPKNKEGTMDKAEVLKALQAKLDAGEKLTEDEQKQFDEITAEMASQSEAEQRKAELDKREKEIKAREDALAAKDKEAEDAKKKKDETDSIVEEERKSAIRAAGKAAGVEVDFTESLVTRKLTVEQATTEIFNKTNNKGEGQKDKQMTKRQLAEAALLNRIDAKRFSVEKTNPYKQNTLLQIATSVVERNAGESEQAYAQRAVASADLAELLSNVANKILVEDSVEEFTYKKIAAEVQLRDFKPTPIVRLSASGLSNKSSETGDYTDTALVDTGESIQLKDRGALFKISYVAMMNDDLGALSKLPQKAAGMGGKDIEDQVYAFLAANGNLSDGKALFHADHGNLIANGNVPSLEQVDAADQLMMAFKDASNNPLDLKTKYLIVPPSLALKAHQVAGVIAPSDTTKVNPYAGKIEVVVSSRIAKQGGNDVWYVGCDPKQFEHLVYGTLQGQGDKPEVQVEEHFDSKNQKIRVTMPSTAGAAGYKGLIKIIVDPA